MKFFIDTANVEDIKKANDMGVICGVTTNPSLIAKEGRVFEEVIAEIASIVDGPISGEVKATTTDAEGMIAEGREIAKIHPNMVVKIPMTGEGLKAVKVLSKGHTAPGLYSTLAQKGFFPKEDLVTLRHTGSYLQGHPDMKHIPGVDMSSGSLGQGISAAVGMAIAGKLDNADYRVYTLLGDGEIQEGQVWEASMLAAHRKLDNLVVIVDNNNLQIDGAITEVNSPYPIDKKFEAFNFHVINIDGNDFDQIDAAFKEAKTVKGQPTAIIAKTVKGKGVSFMENQVGWHGKAPNDEEYKIAMEELEKAGEALCQK